jgi:hypothetical protein
MPHLIKPKFEQLRHEALKSLKPMREAEVAAIQARLVAFLDGLRDVLVEKARRPNHTDPLVEISAAWMGPASSHEEINEVLKDAWPGEIFGDLANDYHLEDIDENVVLRFVATNASNYLTGKVTIRT